MNMIIYKFVIFTKVKFEAPEKCAGNIQNHKAANI